MAEEPRVLVVRRDHPLADREHVSIDETNNEGFVMLTGASRDVHDGWLVDPRPDGSHPRVVATSDDIEGIIELCAAGVGVNIAAASAATHFSRPGLVYVPIDDVPPVLIDVWWRADETSRDVALFIAVAREHYRRSRAES
ncbi:LysR substrate-binding domain-containing protein [Microbacterium amylolyticum]|uniref:LysR substrate-binding domain-containing protein n=1 Tax=Microbacterium amylolyticum TaxID=936337 RepID=UPI001F49F9E2|nr:LysR substrate-binding domain-containing protein [Microbacterium amylolyticum]